MAKAKGLSDIMNLAEAACFVRVSEKTLAEMARTGRLPGQKIGREWRFLRSALENWLSAPISGARVAHLYAEESDTGTLSVREPLAQTELKFGGFRDTAFAENYECALHRWVPWIAGFSSSFVDGVLDKVSHSAPNKVTVLDPFAGVGTTLIEGLKRGHNVVGFEVNPYAAIACRAKVNAPSYDVEILRNKLAAFQSFMAKNCGSPKREPRSRPPGNFATRVPFFSRDIERQVLFCCDFIAGEPSGWVKDLFRTALGAVMVSFSNYSYEPSLGTRVAAGKKNVESADVGAVVANKLNWMIDDIVIFQNALRQFPEIPVARVFAKSFFDLSDELPNGSVDILITSPPYLNNYHYVRNTRPQMFWLNMVTKTSELKEMEKNSFGQFWQTVRGGPPIELLADIKELSELIGDLRSRNPERGHYGGSGWANYAACYFNDCDRFCRTARSTLKPGATAVIVIGNNILQGIEFKTDRFFAEIAERNGFEVVELHEVRKKRTGSSIVNSSVRVGLTAERTRLYETAVELRAARRIASHRR